MEMDAPLRRRRIGGERVREVLVNAAVARFIARDDLMQIDIVGKFFSSSRASGVGATFRAELR